MNKCGNFPLLSAPHSLFSIWTDLKRSEKIPGASARRWGEWIWLTELSGLHRNSPQGLNISSIRVFDQIREQEIPIILRPHFYILKSPFGAKGDWDFWISDLVKTLMELISNPCGEFLWSPEGPLSRIYSPHLHVGITGIFSDLLKSLQML